VASDGHPNSAQPVRPDGHGGYQSQPYGTANDAIIDGDHDDDDDVTSMDLCPTCQGSGRVVRRVVTEADVATPDHSVADLRRAEAAQTEAMAAYGALTGGVRFTSMPRN